ncbi:Gag-Pol polyprotein [Dictyocoela muelleri]|nr:Gag-Pol polyprotein [Dictyocoela muelleri]
MESKSFIKTNQEYENIKKILQGESIKCERFKKTRLIKKSELFIIIENKLYLKGGQFFNDKYVISGENETEMFFYAKLLHDQCHIGVNKLEYLCKQKFLYIKRNIIRNLVVNCEVCKFSMPLKQNDNVNHILAKAPNERFQIDLIDLREYKAVNNNYKWIFSIIDIYSRFGFVRPLESKNSKIIAEILRSLFLEHGPCCILQSDNGTEFKNKNIKDLCLEFGITQIHGRPNNPKSQGIVERFNQTITKFLSKSLYIEEEKIWIKNLNNVIYNYNITIHSALKKSPFQKYKNITGFNSFRPCETKDSPIKELKINDFEINEMKINDCEKIEFEMNRNLNSELSTDWSSNENLECEISYHENFSSELDDFNSAYYKRMDKKMSVHTSKYDFKVNDVIRVKRDLGNNPSYKPKKFEEIYGKEAVIKSILSLNRVLIEYSCGRKETVKMNRIRKK